MDVRACLADPRRYERQIDRLHERYLFTRHLYELQQDDVSLASVVVDRRRVAKLLARTVAAGEYELAPGRIREVRAEGKRRKVFAYPLLDLIVHGVVAGVVEEAAEPALSPSLYSYRKGISWWTPISDFAAFVRAHRRARSDPRERGLYVLRRDVDAYTDSIPVGPASPVWRMLAGLLDQPPLAEADRRLIEGVVRPEVRVPSGGLVTPLRGVPTGQPISCVLFNLYLSELDHELVGVPGGFYARYSDDILFAHPDPGVAREAAAAIDAAVARLDVRLSDTKRRDLYLTGAGRSSAAWPEARGTTRVPFLGTLVAADGAVGLSRKKLRRLLRDLEARARRAASGSPADRDRAGRLACAVVNRALDPRPRPFQQPSATLLRQAVTDRRQLKELDYLLARVVLRAVTGSTSVRAFRTIPYRTIREEWGLVSTLHARNTWA